MNSVLKLMEAERLRLMRREVVLVEDPGAAAGGFDDPPNRIRPQLGIGGSVVDAADQILHRACLFHAEAPRHRRQPPREAT